MGYYRTSDPVKVMNFFEQSLTNDFMVIDTVAVGRLVRVNYLAKLDEGYSARYSWHGWPHAMDGELPEGQEFTIRTPPYE